MIRWPKAALWLEEAWSSRLDDWQADRHRQDKSASETGQVRRAERRKKLRPQLQALREGKAAAGLMHQLALAYDDRFTDIEGETPLDRVVSYLGGDKVESQCAIASFKATLHRADLPSVVEILSLDRQGRYHLVRPACLIGADLAFAESSQAPASWDDALAGRLAAFALTKISNDMPRWFHIITASRPALVAEIFVEYAAPKLQAKKQQHISLLWQLGDDAELADIARRVLPPLLKSFPARALPHQLELLNKALLPAMGTRLSSEERRPLLASRLARRSLDAGQRIALSLAALNSGEQGQIDELVAFVGNSQSRAAHLANAARYQSAGGGHSGADATSLGKLIALLAPHVAPEPQHASGWVSDFDEQRELLRTLVLRLAAMATAEAAKQLLTLRHQVAIRAWRPMLDFALVEHTRIARAASFTHANPQQIIEVIQGGAPANAHDLAALTVEVLRDIAADLRGGESSGLKLFWSHYGRETALPLDEPDCRDLLLDRLKQKLSPLSIAVESEPSAAFDKRADLRVSCWIGGKHVRVPIEVKKDKHRDVWVAWRDQLSQYTSDPACAGVGIYLVLWFGVGSRAAPEGFRPTSSGEMADALKSRTSIEQSARVHMLVMDLSWPNLARR